jgi:hypothetical protein
MRPWRDFPAPDPLPKDERTCKAAPHASLSLQERPGVRAGKTDTALMVLRHERFGITSELRAWMCLGMVLVPEQFSDSFGEPA